MLSQKIVIPNKEDDVKVEEQIVPVEADEIFDLEQVHAVINQFSDDLAANDQTRLQSIFKFIETTLEGTTINIHLNKQHRIQMEDIKAEFLSFLRKALKNNSLVVEYVDVQKKAKGQRAYTSLEKFDAMAEKNPNLLSLKEALGLKVE